MCDREDEGNYWVSCRGLNMLYVLQWLKSRNVYFRWNGVSIYYAKELYIYLTVLIDWLIN